MSRQYACINYKKTCQWNDDFQFFVSNTMAIITQINEGMLLYGYIREMAFVIEEASDVRRAAVFGDRGEINRYKNSLKKLTEKV